MSETRLSTPRFQLQEAHTVPPETLCAYIDAVWPRKTALARPDFYHWQFCQTPGAAGRDASWVVVDGETGQLAGYMGVTPRPFHLADGKTRLAGADLSTWFFSEAVRGTALAWELLEILQTRYEVLMALNCSETALALYRRMGFKYVPTVERLVRVFRLEPFREVVRITPLGRGLLRPAKRQPQEAVTVTPIQHRDELMGLSLSGMTYHHFARDLETLAWRYLHHPVYPYQLFLLNGECGKTRTLVVLRVERQAAFTLAHVLEALPLGEGPAPLVSFLEDFATEHAVDLMDFTCSIPAITASLWAAGWLSTLHDRECWLPHLFNPLELREPPAVSLAFWAKDHLAALCDTARFYVTKGDCDIDRPTGHYFDHALL